MLKIHPDLAFAALRSRHDRGLRVWLLARALDTHGAGCVRLADLRAFLVTNRIRGLSSGTLRRLIRSEYEVFWTTYRDSTRGGDRYLQLRGLTAVCKALGLDKLRRTPVLLPLALARTLAGFRAGLFASFFAGDEFSNPISRTALQALTGASGRTQLRWRRLLCNRLQCQRNAIATDQKWRRGDEIPDGHYVDKLGNQIVLLRRLPNAYRSDFQLTHRGMVRKVNNRLNITHAARLCGAAQVKRERLFYNEPRAAQRRMQSLAEGDTFYLRGAEVGGRPMPAARGGAILWSRFRIADQGMYCG